MTPQQLHRQQKLKQQEERDAPHDCSKWRHETITQVDSHSDEVRTFEICVVCGKEV